MQELLSRTQESIEDVGKAEEDLLVGGQQEEEIR